MGAKATRVASEGSRPSQDPLGTGGRGCGPSVGREEGVTPQSEWPRGSSPPQHPRLLQDANKRGRRSFAALGKMAAKHQPALFSARWLTIPHDSTRKASLPRTAKQGAAAIKQASLPAASQRAEASQQSGGRGTGAALRAHLVGRLTSQTGLRPPLFPGPQAARHWRPPLWLSGTSPSSYG